LTSTLRSENEQLKDEIQDGKGKDSMSKNRIATLEERIKEMEGDLEKSEAARNDLKNDLEEANERFIGIEEELYESK